MRLTRQVAANREAAAVHQLPEVIGGVCVGVAGLGRLETWVQSDHQQHETRSDAVDEVIGGGVGVGGAEGFAGAGTCGGFRPYR